MIWDCEEAVQARSRAFAKNSLSAASSSHKRLNSNLSREVASNMLAITQSINFISESMYYLRVRVSQVE